MSCLRCGDLSDHDLALARAMGPALAAAAKAYLSGQVFSRDAEGPVALTRTEEKVFSLLFRASPGIATYELLLYGSDMRSRRALNTMVTRLRRKLGDEYRITAERDYGYRMTWSAEEDSE